MTDSEKTLLKIYHEHLSHRLDWLRRATEIDAMPGMKEHAEDWKRRHKPCTITVSQ